MTAMRTYMSILSQSNQLHTLTQLEEQLNELQKNLGKKKLFKSVVILPGWATFQIGCVCQ